MVRIITKPRGGFQNDDILSHIDSTLWWSLIQLWCLYWSRNDDQSDDDVQLVSNVDEIIIQVTMDGGRVLEVVEAVLATRFEVIMTSIADLKFVKKIRDHSFWGKEITQKNVFFL